MSGLSLMVSFLVSFTELIRQVQNQYDALSLFQVWQTSLHIGVGFLVSFVGFDIFLDKEAIKAFKRLSELHSNSDGDRDNKKNNNNKRLDYLIFASKYASLTGILTASAIAIIHNNQINLPMAVFYACFGPYFLRNIITNAVFNDSKLSVENEVDKINKQKDQNNKESLEEVVSSLLKKK